MYMHTERHWEKTALKYNALKCQTQQTQPATTEDVGIMFDKSWSVVSRSRD
jgi:hypothetical protein